MAFRRKTSGSPNGESYLAELPWRGTVWCVITKEGNMDGVDCTDMFALLTATVLVYRTKDRTYHLEKSLHDINKK